MCISNSRCRMPKIMFMSTSNSRPSLVKIDPSSIARVKRNATIASERVHADGQIAITPTASGSIVVVRTHDDEKERMEVSAE